MTIPSWNLFSPFSSEKAWKGVFSYLCFFFPISYSQEDFEYILKKFASHLSLIEFEFNSIVELKLNLVIEWNFFIEDFLSQAIGNTKRLWVQSVVYNVIGH